MNKIKIFFSKYWKTLLGIAIVIFIAIMLFSGRVKVNIKEDSIKLDSMGVASSEIKYSEIETIEIKKEIDLGSRKFGVGSIKLKTGDYNNTEFGAYKLYSYSSIKTYVVIKTSDKYYVYNLSTEELTQKSYNTLFTKINT